MRLVLIHVFLVTLLLYEIKISMQLSKIINITCFYELIYTHVDEIMTQIHKG